MSVEYANEPRNLNDLTKQDSIILNIQRACEASIDLAMHLVSRKNLGIPQHSREAFELLSKANLIDETLLKAMIAMVGFRNVAIHDYQSVQLGIIQAIVEKHLVDLERFATVAKSIAC